MSMFPVMNTDAGMAIAFPDVCKVPTPGGPVPTPFPNNASASDGDGSSKVKVMGCNVLRKGDKIRMSSGDEGGSLMGVVSNKIKGEGVVRTGSPKVKVEG